MNPDELVQLGTEIALQGSARGATLRLYGGVAVCARCPGIESHPGLQRQHADLDLIAAREGWSSIPDLLLARGFALTENLAARMVFTREDLKLDVRSPYWREYFALDFSSRLTVETTTLPLADLLLLKLQRVQFADKDIKDAVALLLDHRVASGGDSETIDREYIYRLTNRNWGLWTTVYDNTVTLEKILDKYLEPEEAQLVWRRIELLQEVLDGKGKSLGWWGRALLGKRFKWYHEPEK